ncbi:hypothetical protein GGI15_000246 [Coemansia interrupta]|uniref:Uncharacterized protein n=1 Tax=Coemansia interrupta TaxID=1126814 RepID=A0A9W8LNN2_9FUNG|nr:hypothetical protein GGI15_000246 [Coemansia interrupta]
MSRVKVDDEYNISDWYSASRESRAISMAADNQQSMGNFQNAHNTNPMPQRRPVNNQIIVPVQGNHQHRQQPRLQPVHDHYQQQQQQQQRHRQNQHQKQLSASHIPSYYNNDSAPSQFQSSRQQHQPPNNNSEPMNYYGNFDEYGDGPIGSRNNGPNPYGAYNSSYEYAQRPVTASTIGSAHAMGVSYPEELHSKQSHQQLLPKLSIPSAKEKGAYSEPTTASAGYSPPSHPDSLAMQYSATSQLSRSKTVNDRYTRRNAGGDSCMGECCESCCGRFMRCTCCCLGPIISWILVVLVLVGIALALYFNWDRIRNSINKLENSATAATSSSAADATPTPADVLNTISSILSSPT